MVEWRQSSGPAVGDSRSADYVTSSDSPAAAVFYRRADDADAADAWKMQQIISGRLLLAAAAPALI